MIDSTTSVNGHKRVSRVRDELPADERRFYAILDTAEDAIISLDEASIITLFNQGAEKIFGYTAPEVLGRPLDILLPTRFVRVHRKHIAEFVRSGVASRKMGERRKI